MHISYENELGRVSMGGNSQSLWRVVEITGIGLPEKTFNSVTYAGQDGQHTLSSVSNARTITISGNIKNNGQLRYELTRAVKIFNKEGYLKLHFGNKRRKIYCRVNAFEPDKRNGAFQPFVLQLIADKPDFEDFENTTVAVFKRSDKIISPFTLPMIFTERISEVNILNLGDRRSEPVFYITNLGGVKSSITVKAIKDGHTTTLFNNIEDSDFVSGKIGVGGRFITVKYDNVSVYADGNVLYSEDFEDGAAQDWVLNNFEVTNNLKIPNYEGQFNTAIYNGRTFSGNYIYKVDVYTTAVGISNKARIFFNYIDDNNHYRVEASAGDAGLNPFIQLIKVVNGTETVLATYNNYVIRNSTVTFEIAYKSASITDNGGISIQNLTTNQHIKLNTQTLLGEVIKIDIPRRKVISSLRGDVIKVISDDTFLSDFWLDVGNNIIKLTNFNTNEVISAVCEYTNKYIEAVY